MASSADQKDQIRRLYLSDSDKKILGVCGGLAEYFSVDSTLIRLGWVVLTIVTAIVPGLLGYFVAALVIPVKPS